MAYTTGGNAMFYKTGTGDNFNMNPGHPYRNRMAQSGPVPTPQAAPMNTDGLMYGGGAGPSGGMMDPNAGVQGGGGGYDVFDQSAQGYGAGMGTLGRVANPFAVNMTMNQFVNPYRQAVIDNALYRSREQQDIALNNVRGQAAQSGAYGGARQGLVEAELMDRYNQNDNEMLARLLQQGFDTRANLSLSALGQQAGAAQGLIGGAQAGQGMGMQGLQAQGAAGRQQQSLMQAILGQASGQTETMLNYPQQSLATAMAGVQGNPLANNVSSSSTYNPGLFDYLSLGAGTYSAGK